MHDCRVVRSGTMAVAAACSRAARIVCVYWIVRKKVPFGAVWFYHTEFPIEFPKSNRQIFSVNFVNFQIFCQLFVHSWLNFFYIPHFESTSLLLVGYFVEHQIKFFFNRPFHTFSTWAPPQDDDRSFIVLTDTLQKQSLAFAVYLFGIGTLHTGPGLKKKHM